ncbi:hypothetical protein HK099_006677 [Clydaea vesicula]|uniref:Uncharacterized protein n=1 Tax=Clydaea vesicula TaxID=447962 RepID=A0AAD5U0W6_9FUNG|nr:hypothetical protein HK099_006677 [Clydaea vesicula]
MSLPTTNDESPTALQTFTQQLEVEESFSASSLLLTSEISTTSTKTRRSNSTTKTTTSTSTIIETSDSISSRTTDNPTTVSTSTVLTSSTVTTSTISIQTKKTPSPNLNTSTKNKTEFRSEKNNSSHRFVKFDKDTKEKHTNFNKFHSTNPEINKPVPAVSEKNTFHKDVDHLNQMKFTQTFLPIQMQPRSLDNHDGLRRRNSIVVPMNSDTAFFLQQKILISQLEEMEKNVKSKENLKHFETETESNAESPTDVTYLPFRDSYTTFKNGINVKRLNLVNPSDPSFSSNFTFSINSNTTPENNLNTKFLDTELTQEPKSLSHTDSLPSSPLEKVTSIDETNNLTDPAEKKSPIVEYGTLRREDFTDRKFSPSQIINRLNTAGSSNSAIGKREFEERRRRMLSVYSNDFSEVNFDADAEENL